MSLKAYDSSSYSHSETVPFTPPLTPNALPSYPDSPSYSRSAWSPTDRFLESPGTFKPPRRPTSYRSFIEFEEEYPLTQRDMEGTLQYADQQAQRATERDLVLKKNIRRFRFVVRVLDLGCSLVIIALIASNFIVFNATRFSVNDSGNPIWGAEHPRTWPTTVLLSVACVSVALSVVVLLSYLKSVQWANRFNIAHATITISVSVFLIIMWAISIGIFNYHDQSATPDLWSRACHQRDAGTPNGAVNWGQYCIEQAWCSVCGILSIIFEALILTTFALIYLRRRSKRDVRQSRQYATFVRTATALQEQQSPYDPSMQKSRAVADEEPEITEWTIPEGYQPAKSPPEYAPEE